MTEGFVFREQDRIGAAAAEDDTEFLSQCFVDTGLLGFLQDPGDKRCVVLGRTGAGKTALLMQLQESAGEAAILLSPQDLALTYVSNSTILAFLASIGVNLDPFFKLLWRHVLVVELLRRHFERNQSEAAPSFWDHLLSLFPGTGRRDKEAREAVAYLREWGESFWQETEYRVKEITKRFETDLEAHLSGALGPPGTHADLSAGGGRKMSKEEKTDVCSRAQRIVAQAQVQDLQKVMRLLPRILEEPQWRYYIVIDHLDEDWVEERLRYRLIMALIATAREFMPLPNVKVILALRRDLVDRVFRVSRDAGFQEEKYESLYLQIRWTKTQLIALLDKRIDALVRRRYTKRTVTHADLLPVRWRETPIDDFIYDRAQRPRDMISFFNHCIAAAPSLGRLTVSELSQAEREYSTKRLRALGDEWNANYPGLLDFVQLLRGREWSLKLGTVANRDVEELCLRLAVEFEPPEGLLQTGARAVAEAAMSADEFKRILLKAFYRTGLVGLKLASHEKPSWSDDGGRAVPTSDLNDDVSVLIHPAYRRALGTVGESQRRRHS